MNTVWSAPNYCYRCGNVASILEFDKDLKMDFKIFEEVPLTNRAAPLKKVNVDYFL